MRKADDEWQVQTRSIETKIEKLSARNNEIDKLFGLIYEDKLKGKLTDERFAKMSGGYVSEQTANKNKLHLLSEQQKAVPTKSTQLKCF